jgi:ELWxxDGT repeat protein
MRYLSRSIRLTVTGLVATAALVVTALPAAAAAHPSSNPSEIVRMGSRVYFAAETSADGRELWTSDGTAAGTHQVKDIYAAGSSSPQDLTVVGDRVFFIAYDGTDNKLWVTDGSKAGTIPLSGAVSPINLRAVGDRLFFIDDWDNFPTVWTSDGTPGGTGLVNAWPPDVVTSQWQNGAAAFMGEYFYVVRVSTGGGQWELWRSDGTSVGTSRVAAVGVSISEEQGATDPRDLVVSGGLLYFRVQEGGLNGGYESDDLWKSDGSGPGTRKVKDLDGIEGSDYVRDLTNVSGTLFFTNRDDELWKSNGTRRGTKLVKVVNPFASRAPVSLTRVGNRVFFPSYTSASASDLWRSKGTAATTVMVDPATPYACWDQDGPPNPHDPPCVDLDYTPAAVGLRVFFPSADGGKGIELWVSDGTDAGTFMVKNINAAIAHSRPSDLANGGSVLFFVAKDANHGRELWVSDGTGPGTHLVKDINPG